MSSANDLSANESLSLGFSGTGSSLYPFNTDSRYIPVPPHNIGSLIIGVDIARELRREKISHRLKQRLDEGMVNEVKALLDSGISSEDLIYYGLEYKYLTLYVLGKLSFNEMFHQLEIAIHQFAKRQMTWFRGMERRGFTIHWLDACLPMEDKVEKIINLLHTKN